MIHHVKTELSKAIIQRVSLFHKEKIAFTNKLSFMQRALFFTNGKAVYIGGNIKDFRFCRTLPHNLVGGSVFQSGQRNVCLNLMCLSALTGNKSAAISYFLT